MACRDITEFKAYLETLTTGELIGLADQSGIDVPPDLDRPFIIRELLDNRYDDPPSGEFAAEGAEPEASLLPRQHQITFLEVLPRDPQWAYVFWEIKAQDREQIEGDPRFAGYLLKALELKDSLRTELFSISVGVDDYSWYLGFPPGGNFQVALRAEGSGVLLALSRPFALPRFLNSPGYGNTPPLAALSGAPDFTVLRAPDRIPRRRI
ncbi:MAG: DUF4912 domain-containing protein [Treponema sp.]|jgi:hypothetical protein|nr:DUF4912 domain-containing protein [Treponema sp.]